MNRSRMRPIAVLLLSALLITAALLPQVTATAEPQQDPELWKVLRPLPTVVSFMNTGAHPDDERSALLAWLSLGQGVRTSSVLANRGEGGQNEIGDELGNGLGIIRSRELQEAADLLGIRLMLLSERLNDPIYDFGFSKSPEETLSKWGESTVYERLIRRIREERPDIVMPSFRDVPSEHGHHRTVTQLTLRAFRDAADPGVFPEHLKQGLRPWQVKKLYLPGTPETETLRFNIGGQVDPVYGMTYPQLGEESRKLHKSQGMGRDLPVEDYPVSLELVHSAVGDIKKEASLFEDLPVSFTDLAENLSDPQARKPLMRLQGMLEAALKAYPDRAAVTEKVQEALRQVRRAEDAVREGNLKKSERQDVLFRLHTKEKQLQKASAVASRVETVLSVDNPVLTRGTTAAFRLEIRNNGSDAITDLKVTPRVPAGWNVEKEPVPGHLAPGNRHDVSFRVQVPDGAEFFDPYGPPAVRAEVSYRLLGVTVERTVVVDPLKQTVAVLPDWGMQLKPGSTILNTDQKEDPKDITVEVTNHRPEANTGSIRPVLPDGWRAEPTSHPVAFLRQGEKRKVTFRLHAPDGVQPGEYRIGWEARVNGRTFSTQVQPISYDHIGTSYWLTDATLHIQAFPLKMAPGLKIGYVESGFDQVAEHLRQAGLDVTSLDEESLASGDLSRYDTIVVGIRAYLSRNDLLKNNHRLLEYVKNGGHVVMQYHKPEDRWSPDLPPYPITPGSPSIQWRVTDENAPVTMLKPDHPLFRAPNEITEKDFEGWIQERGLYFPSQWDSAYTPLLSMADPGEEPFHGGLLVADYGEGSYIYTNLVWYRQIQNQVPGGYRMFINLVSYPANR